ncbi:MAG: hypothetical protein KKA42_08660, partial [candidate division Zixibacteria bacterium]|nr:hypothetical protein [candidate division Zixibacteria bacterium]
MVALKGNDISSVPIQDVAGKLRKVTHDHSWVKTARSIGICLGVDMSSSLADAFEKNDTL